jgi:hypothetical protein
VVELMLGVVNVVPVPSTVLLVGLLYHRNVPEEVEALSDTVPSQLRELPVPVGAVLAKVTCTDVEIELNPLWTQVT